jgi:hypothetical protein
VASALATFAAGYLAGAVDALALAGGIVGAGAGLVLAGRRPD